MNWLWGLVGVFVGGAVVFGLLWHREYRETLRLHNAKVLDRWAKISEEQDHK